MGIFDRFPYSSTHEMNLDFMLGKATEIAEGLQDVQTGLEEISTKTEQATQAAAQAVQAASSIEGSVSAAEEAAEEAQMHNESAQTWANNAMTYKADCQRAASEAAASSTSAAQAATAAAASEDTVATYAQAANASAQSAANNNDSAHQYANQASASASNATFHSSNAQTAATNAQTAATNANTSATNASASADRAAFLKTDVETLHGMCTAAVNQAATEAVNAANSAAQAAATKTDVETLVESLPEDFTDLNNTVNQLSDEIDALDSDVTDLKSAITNSEDVVYRLANAANIDEPYERTGTATSGSTAWAETVTVKNITLRAGERYIFEVSANEPLASGIYSELHEANRTEITSLLLETGQTNAHKTFVASRDYENAYIVFKTGITTGITLTNKISIDSSIPAIEVLKNNAMQDILAIPLKNASGSAITNYRVYYFSIKTGAVFHAITKNGTGMNLLATYADGTTGILSDVDGNDKTVTVIKDIKYLGYYLSSGFDDVLYIYGDLYLEQRAELEQIKNIADNKNGSFSITGYVKSDGSINSSDANAKRTDYIPVEQYDHLFVDTVIGAAGCSIAFYDGNKTFISSGSETGAKRNYTKAIPQNAKYVIFSEYAFHSASAYLYVDGSVAREQVLDKKDIADLQTWSRKIFDTDALGTFAKFGVCGDSLSVGYMDDSGGTAHGRNIYYSWGQVLARRYGNVCLNFGFSGCTTKTWYTDATHGRVEFILPENLCQCYLVGLGANDSVDDSNVGTASDINLSDYTQNADTFYGNYGKVLQLILYTAQHGYVFALTLPTLSYATDLKNNAIRGAVEKINNERLFLVDLEQDYKYLFTSGFIADNVVGAHYSALGYANIATAISIAVTDVMNKNNTNFTDLAFAPYGSNDVIE